MDSILIEIEGVVHALDEHVKVISKFVSKHVDLITRNKSKVDENSEDKLVDGLFALHPIQVISISDVKVRVAEDSHENKNMNNKELEEYSRDYQDVWGA